MERVDLLYYLLGGGIVLMLFLGAKMAELQLRKDAHIRELEDKEYRQKLEICFRVNSLRRRNQELQQHREENRVLRQQLRNMQFAVKNSINPENGWLSNYLEKHEQKYRGQE